MVYRIGAWVVLALLAQLLAPADTARAQRQDSSSYVVDQWQVEDGLPQGSVLDIAQTPDRYLWLATRDGLARFDGLSFTVYNKTNTPAFHSNRVNALHRAADGGLWIGTERGLVRYRGGHFEALAEDHPLVSAGVRALAGDGAGTLWIDTDGELVRYRRGQFQTLQAGQYPNLANTLNKRPYVDSEGRLWLLFSHRAAVLEDGRFRVYTRNEGGLPDDELAAIGERGDGTLYVGTQTGQLAKLVEKDHRFVPAGRLQAGAGRTGAYLFGDEEGQVWTASSTIRAHRIRGQGAAQVAFRFDRPEINANTEKVFYEDQAGNVWVGTRGGGLFRLRRRLFEVYDATDGLSYDVTLSLTQAPDSSLWVGTNCQGLNRLQGGQFTKYAGPAVPPDACLYATLASRDGGLWVGHAGLVRIFPDGGGPGGVRRQRYELPYDSTRRRRGDAVKALYEDPAHPGVLWVGTIDGLYRLERGASPADRYTLARHYRAEDGLQHDQVRYVLRHRQSGALWIAGRDGLSRLEGGQFISFTPERGGFPSRSPRALYEDASGTLWIGTYGDGLVRYQDGEFVPITRADGLFDDVVSAIVPDGRGYLWMSGNRGIFRARLEDLNAFADGAAERVPSAGYGREVGLKNPETNGGFQPAAWKDYRRRLWFPTLQGVAVVDPAQVEARDAPPTPHVEAVRHQNETLPLAGAAGTLPEGQRSFEVGYTGVDLTTPEAARFQYRLAGFDDGWQQAGTRRRAFYTNVPPGDYRFEVRAAGATGAWSAPAARRLRVPPHFYETTWFVMLCGLAAVGLLAGGVAGRFWVLRRREARLRQRVDKQTTHLRKEKQRAADALSTVAEQKEALVALETAKSEFFANVSHEFRTPLTVVLGLLEDWVEAPEADLPAAAREDLRQVLYSSRRLLRLVNQLLEVASLESNTLTLRVQHLDLAAFLAPLAESFGPLAERRRVTFEHALPDAPVRAAADPDQVETIVTNLLSNAFKFTPEGGRVTLALEQTAEAVAIRVADTGPGIPKEDQAAIFERFEQVEAVHASFGNGIGLSLAKALAERHGGTLTVDSAAGEGATFTARFPRGADSLADRPDVAWRKGEDRWTPGSAEELPAPKAIADAWSAQGDGAAPAALSRLDDPFPDDPFPPEPGRDERPVVLIVDDHADIRAYVRRHLAPAYRVEEAADGRAGLERARALTPDCVVADVMMPQMGGVELLRTLRGDAATDFIPVVLLTARAAPEDKLEGLEAGADDYLTKPFRPDELKTRVRNLIAQRMRLRERFQAGEGPSGEVAGNAAPPAHETPMILSEARAAVGEHLGDESFGVSALADALGVSRSTLYRRLKKETDASPGELIWQVRLEHARDLLREAEGTVSEVAYGVGFKSVSHFTNRFREHFGQSPSVVHPATAHAPAASSR